ncbi:MAG: tetratricopeptide repeat protein [Verrucomicrobia bacterium]|nr:tetratricopeptide repeat protein [Verrucomicrobiota bacterium]
MNHAPTIRRTLRILGALLCAAALAGCAAGLRAEETNAPAAVEGKEREATGIEALRSYLHLQEQLHATQLALERNRLEAETLAARNAEAVSLRLQLIEQAVSAQRLRELDAMQSTNRLLLTLAGSLAGVGFLAMLLTAYLQWRAVNRLAEFTTVLTGPRGALRPVPADLPPASPNAAEQSGERLLGALNRLEERIHQLEHNTQLPLPEKAPPTAASSAISLPAPAAPVDANGEDESRSRLSLLLAKGESLLSLDKATEALACFEEVLAAEPNHAEALVKKGQALAQLRRLDEALTCYDRAIAADDSFTIAYLHKGGLFNQMERYEEALQCYEQALRTQEKPAEN